MPDDRGHHFETRKDPLLHPRATRAACSCGWKGRWHYDPSQPGKGRERLGARLPRVGRPRLPMTPFLTRAQVRALVRCPACGAEPGRPCERPQARQGPAPRQFSSAVRGRQPASHLARVRAAEALLTARRLEP